MTTNINKVIEEWIGNNRQELTHAQIQLLDRHEREEYNQDVTGYNEALADLRSRIPELEEKIVRIIR